MGQFVKFGNRYPKQPETYLKNKDQEGSKKFVSERIVDLLGPQTSALSYPSVPKEAVEKVSKVNEVADHARNEALMTASFLTADLRFRRHLLHRRVISNLSGQLSHTRSQCHPSSRMACQSTH